MSDLNWKEITLGLATAVTAYIVPPAALIPGGALLALWAYERDPDGWRGRVAGLLESAPARRLLTDGQANKLLDTLTATPRHNAPIQPTYPAPAQVAARVGGRAVAAPVATAPQRTLVPPPPAAAAGGDDGDRLFGYALDAYHLLVIGYTRGGKTTFVHELSQRLVATGVQVIVCDPDAGPGLWEGCAVYGAGDDYEAIDGAFGWLQEEIKSRRQQRATKGGRRRFPALYVIVDEYASIAQAIPKAKTTVEDTLRRGAKLDIHFILGVQDKQVKTLGWEGQGELRRSFTYTFEMQKGKDGGRYATVTDNNEEHIGRLRVPVLPDIEAIAQRANDAALLANLFDAWESPAAVTEPILPTVQTTIPGIVVQRKATDEERIADYLRENTDELEQDLRGLRLKRGARTRIAAVVFGGRDSGNLAQRLTVAIPKALDLLV